ncbi:MAG: hypothetical protein AVDCRST_MAG70-622, partial [uncultured Thermomicrobiales bacterium]
GRQPDAARTPRRRAPDSSESAQDIIWHHEHRRSGHAASVSWSRL